MKHAVSIIPSYDDLGRLCCEVIGPEMARLGCECPEPGYCFTIEHGGYKPQDIDIEYCEKVSRKGSDSDIIKFKDIPEVPTAVCLKVLGSYDKLYRWHLEPGRRGKVAHHHPSTCRKNINLIAKPRKSVVRLSGFKMNAAELK